MKQPTEQQLKDPKWWDEWAPKGATHFVKEDGIGAAAWRKKDGNNNWLSWLYEDDDSWGSVSNRRETIPRPAQWQGPKDGLPPVGYTQDDCALVHLDESDKFTVVAHHHGHAIVAFGPNEDGGMVMSTAARESDFITSKTERDKAADDFLKITGVHYSWHHTLGLIHDAGYRKMIDRDNASNILHDMVVDAVQKKGGDLFECLDTNKALDALGYKE